VSSSTVSVLICTRDRPAMLDRALDALGSGTRAPDQLVVVNGGGDAGNAVVAAHASAFGEVVLIQYRNHNLATSRNLGLVRCSGDVVAMTDDDAVVAPEWLEQIVEAHRADPSAGAIGGPVLGACRERFLSRLADCVVFPHFAARRGVHNLPGVNVSYKLAAIRAVGEFDPMLDRGEDVDFNQRLAEMGWGVVYEPSIRVTHEHRSTVWGLLEQQYRYGRSYVLVRRRHAGLYCVYPRTLRGWRDWLKLAHCLAAVLYQPALASRRMPATVERPAALPILVLHHAAWKAGMLRQALDREPVRGSVSPAVSGVWEWRASLASSSRGG
jgi:glycosyltransferase involved in cell wall biosynthesis